MNNNKEIKELRKNIRNHLDAILEENANKNIDEISERINGILDYWKSQEIWKLLKIKGYSKKTLIEKIAGRRPIKRQRRNDDGEIRNSNLNCYWEKIKECALSLFLENKRPSLEKLRELILKKLNQENGELSRVPIGTFRKQLKKLLEKLNQENIEKDFNNKLKTKQKIYFAGWNTKEELAKIIFLTNQEQDSEKKTEKFLMLIKIKV